jgi:hypothetical protein
MCVPAMVNHGVVAMLCELRGLFSCSVVGGSEQEQMLLKWRHEISTAADMAAAFAERCGPTATSLC